MGFGAFGIFEAGSIRGYLGLRGQIFLCFRRQGSRGRVASHKGGNRGISHRLEKKEAWDRILEIWKKKEGGPGGSPSDLEKRILCSFKGRGSELSPTF